MVANKDGKAFKSSTGLLKVVERVAREPRSGLPGFIGRWDPRLTPRDRWSGGGALRASQHTEMRECALRCHTAGLETLRS